MKCCSCGIEFECNAKRRGCEHICCYCKKCWKKTRWYIENPNKFYDCYGVYVEPEKVKFD